MFKKLIIVIFIFITIGAFTLNASVNQSIPGPGENIPYDPSTHIYIDAKNDMLSFDDNKLPEFLKDMILNFPAPGADIPIDKISAPRIKHNLKIFEYMTNRFSGEHPLYIEGQGIKFDVIIIPDIKWGPKVFKFTVTFSDYLWENSKIFEIQGIKKIEHSQEDFENLKFTWANHITESAQYLVNKYSNMREKQIKIIEQNFRENEILKENENLEDRIKNINTGLDNIPIEDLLFLAPVFNLSDFLPEEVFIQSMQVEGGFILGLCMLEADIIYYDPSAIVFDYFKYNDVVLHEMVHNNSYLQTMIAGTYIDHELQTSFSERYNAGFKYLYHGYLRGVNKHGKIIFSFDADRARREMINSKGSDSGITFNDDAVNKYIPMAAKVKEEMGKSIIDRFMPIQYLYPIFYGCVGDELYNKHGSVYLTLDSDFAFSILNGPENTQIELNKYKAVIKKVYETALAKTEVTKKENEEKAKKAISTVLPIIKKVGSIIGMNTNNTDYEILKQFYELWNNGLISLPQMITKDTFRGKDPTLSLSQVMENGGEAFDNKMYKEFLNGGKK